MSGITLSRLFPPPALPSPGTAPVDAPASMPALVKRCTESGVLTGKDLFGLTDMQLCDLLDVSLPDARVCCRGAPLFLFVLMC